MTTQYPLITVGMTTYNAEDSVVEALDSATKQNWPNLEFVVVDDCSTDRTPELLRHWAAEDKIRRRIIYLPNNGGVAVARNTVVQLANGEYIAFFDDDDFSLPNRIMMQFARLSKYEALLANGEIVICHTSTQRNFPDGRKLFVPTMGCNEDGKAPSGIGVAKRILLGYPLKNAYGSLPTCSQFARRETYITVGGFDEEFRRGEDTDLAIRLALHGAHFVGLCTPLVIQKMTGTSEKSLSVDEHFTSLIIEKHRSFIEEHGNYQFTCRWHNLRSAWFRHNLPLFLTLLTTTLLRYPTLSYRRIFLALPHILHNRLMRKFLRKLDDNGTPFDERGQL